MGAGDLGRKVEEERPTWTKSEGLTRFDSGKNIAYEEGSLHIYSLI